MKHQGYLGMYTGIDVMQTKNYIKISCKLFIEKICDKYLISWMHNFTSTDDCPTPLPMDPLWFKQFNAAIGDPDPKVQCKLAKKMQITYCCGVGELIWAMTTTRPDLAFPSVKLSQANSDPDKHHYHGVKHVLKYLYSDDGIYTFGGLLLVWNFLKVLSQLSTVTNKFSSLTIALNTMQTLHIHTQT